VPILKLFYYLLIKALLSRGGAVVAHRAQGSLSPHLEFAISSDFLVYVFGLRAKETGA